jgi:hypothetical protein
LGGLAIPLFFQTEQFSNTFCRIDRALLGGFRQRLSNRFKARFKFT